MLKKKIDQCALAIVFSAAYGTDSSVKENNGADMREARGKFAVKAFIKCLKSEGIIPDNT